MPNEALWEAVELSDFWEQTVSRDTVPPLKTFHIWLASFDRTTIENGIRATTRKLEMAQRHGEVIEAESLARYCSACCRNAREEARLVVSRVR